MKILIIDNPRPLTMEHYNDVANAPLSASLNSGYALALARHAGWDAVHLDFSATDHDPPAMALRILAEKSDLILFHWVYAWGDEQRVSDTMALLRRADSAPVGAFGLFPTLAHRQLLQFAPQLDFILKGEFEATLSDLLDGFMGSCPPGPIPGLVLRSHPFAHRPLIKDLSLLPTPDDLGSNLGYPSLNIAASRGCFGTCSFCFIHGYYGCSRRRSRELSSLEEELETRLARRDIRSIYFIDPTFIGHGNEERERAVEIGRMAERFKLPFGFETRVDTIDERIMHRLTAHGANSVFLGIESGCNSVLQRIGKRIDTDQIRRAIRTVRECGLKLNLGFIMFEPDSTLAELKENYAFLEELVLLDNHELTANLLYHKQIVLYGTAAWQRFGQEGRLLLDERYPFEARYRFRDERVALVSAAMGRLSAEYFKGIDALRKKCISCDEATRVINSDRINALLKEAFLAFCAAAGNPDQDGLSKHEDSYINSLQQMLALPSPRLAHEINPQQHLATMSTDKSRT